MWKDDACVVEIVQASAKALAYIESVDQAEFESNEMLHDAVMLQMVVIGEAAKNLSVAFREAHPEIPWAKIRATRNVVAHAYQSVELDRIWIAVTEGLPAILAVLKPLVPPDIPHDEAPPSATEVPPDGP